VAEHCLPVVQGLRCQLQQIQTQASAFHQQLHHACQTLPLSQSDFQSSDSTDDISTQTKTNLFLDFDNCINLIAVNQCCRTGTIKQTNHQRNSAHTQNSTLKTCKI